MEENNKKQNKKIFYLMLGVSILLISGITATFAYFSASKTAGSGTITGDTNNINNDTLTLNVQKIAFTGATANTNLVPAYFGKTNDTLNVPTPASLTQNNVISMISNKCEKDGYTGCHVYSITFSSSQTISEANLLLNLTVTGATNTTQWGYALFTETGDIEAHETTGLALLTGNGVPGSIGSGVTNLDIHNAGGLTANTPVVYYLVVYVNDNDTVQNTAGDNYVVGSYNGSVTLQAMGGEVKAKFVKTAAEYVTELYTNASKSTATVNSISYNLAPSVNLMDDKLGGTASSGNIRYYGANPNNYVWLGDTYTESYTIPGDPRAGTPDINVVANTRKLWRIIGVFNGKLKLISADPISAQKLSWDTSANTTGGNSGNGINQWGPSNSYEGADLMKLLNPGYEGESVNNSLYWRKTSGTVYTYTGGNNATTANVSFASAGLTETERNLIDTERWYLGAYDNYASYVNVQYAAERQSTTLGKICSGGDWCNDTVTRTSYWDGKVGLMYPSDYGYAADLLQCNQTLYQYSNTSCKNSDWMNIGQLQWTISPRATSGSADGVFRVGGGGSVGSPGAYGAGVVRPAVYLKSGVTISGGNGSQSQPFEIS